MCLVNMWNIPFAQFKKKKKKAYIHKEMNVSQFHFHTCSGLLI